MLPGGVHGLQDGELFLICPLSFGKPSFFSQELGQIKVATPAYAIELSTMTGMA
jgi:hypothetical protein